MFLFSHIGVGNFRCPRTLVAKTTGNKAIVKNLIPGTVHIYKNAVHEYPNKTKINSEHEMYM